MAARYKKIQENTTYKIYEKYKLYADNKKTPTLVIGVNKRNKLLIIAAK